MNEVAQAFERRPCLMRSALGLVGWLAVSLATGFIGSRFLPDQWYASIVKPSFTPPPFVFAPVWTALYVLMALAAWLVWRLRGFGGASLALSLFIAQLALNALWSYLFFGAHAPLPAFIDIIALEFLILATLVAFWRTSALAGILMIPYAAWVGFASVLNFSIWRLNN
jgi:tryptophan-rich sensory protein